MELVILVFLYDEIVEIHGFLFDVELLDIELVPMAEVLEIS